MGAFGPFELFGDLFDGIIDIFEDGMFTAGGIVALILLLAAGISSLIGSITGLVFYIMYSLGLHRMAKQLDACHPVLAWLPFAQYFAIGKIAERCDERRGITSKAWGKILLICSIGGMAAVLVLSVLAAGCYLAMALLGIIGMIGAMLFEVVATAVAFVPMILSFVCIWKMFKVYYKSPMDVVLFIVSLLLSVQPITVLIASFRTPMPAAYEQEQEEDIFA